MKGHEGSGATNLQEKAKSYQAPRVPFNGLGGKSTLAQHPKQEELSIYNFKGNKELPINIGNC